MKIEKQYLVSKGESMMLSRVGQQLGNYRLVRLLGSGGFAQVYLGEHVLLHTQAAIKVLQTQIAASDRDNFLTEAQTIAHLEHPHIVRVLDFDVAEGIPFLVMSYAPNGTLRQRHPKGTQLPLPTIITYVKQLANALQYAHDEKLIHRDVKPENMLVGRRNEVLLSDFGIALIAQSSRFQSTQDVIGTVAYMAPEQIQGKPRPASDQYSLAIVVYEWLCGDRPFSGSFTELCTQHMYATPAPLHEKVPTIPPGVEYVVLTALAKDPRQRFASVQVFATAFEQASTAPTQVPAKVPDPPIQSLLSPLYTSSQANPPAASLTLSAQIPALPSAQAGSKHLHTPSPESNRALPPTLSALQPATPLPFERPTHHRGFSWYKAVILVALALLIVGSAGFIFKTVLFRPVPFNNTSIGKTSFTKQLQQLLPISATTRQLQVHNRVGNLSIMVDSTVTQATLSAVEKVQASSSSDANKEFGRISVSAKTGSDPSILVVNATVPDTSGGLLAGASDSVDLTIVLPLSVVNKIPPLSFTLSASVAWTGDMSVQNFIGLLNLTGNMGNISVQHGLLIEGSCLQTNRGNVTFDGLLAIGANSDTGLIPCTANTTQNPHPWFSIKSEVGNVDVTLSTETTNVILDASTNSGKINAGDFNLNIQQNSDGSASYNGPLIAGTSPTAMLVLGVSTGNITLHKGA